MRRSFQYWGALPLPGDPVQYKGPLPRRLTHGVNRFVTGLRSSPLWGPRVSRHLTIVTYTGRRSGRTFARPSATGGPATPSRSRSVCPSARHGGGTSPATAARYRCTWTEKIALGTRSPRSTARARSPSPCASTTRAALPLSKLALSTFGPQAMHLWLGVRGEARYRGLRHRH